MGAFTVTTTVVQKQPGACKEATVTITGPASYDTGGSVADLSHANFGSLTAVHGAHVISNTAIGDAKYQLAYIPAAAGAPGTGKFAVFDMTQHPGAEVPSTTNLSGSSWNVKVFGA